MLPNGDEQFNIIIGNTDRFYNNCYRLINQIARNIFYLQVPYHV